MCMSTGLHACMCTNVSSTLQCPQRPEEGDRSPRPRVLAGYERPCGCWELNPAPLEWLPANAFSHWAISPAPKCSFLNRAKERKQRTVLIVYTCVLWGIYVAVKWKVTLERKSRMIPAHSVNTCLIGHRHWAALSSNSASSVESVLASFLESRLPLTLRRSKMTG